MPMDIATNHFDIVMANTSIHNEAPCISPTFIPLFTNEIIGLKRVDHNRTTDINLVDYSYERDDEGDNPSEKTELREEDGDESQNDSSSSDSGNSGNDENHNQHDDQQKRHQSQARDTSVTKITRKLAK